MKSRASSVIILSDNGQDSLGIAKYINSFLALYMSVCIYIYKVCI